MYLGTLDEKKTDRNKCKLIHDRLYNGFYAFDRHEDGECARETKSGWWFPHRVYRPSGGADHLKINGNSNCDYRREYDTNLNGMFDEDADVNGRAIVLCTKQNSEQCYVQKDTGWCSDRLDYEFKDLISIKLTTTKMYMYRRKL